MNANSIDKAKSLTRGILEAAEELKRITGKKPVIFLSKEDYKTIFEGVPYHAFYESDEQEEGVVLLFGQEILVNQEGRNTYVGYKVELKDEQTTVQVDEERGAYGRAR